MAKTTKLEDNLELLDGFINYTGKGRDIYKSVLYYIRQKLEGYYDGADDVMQNTQIKVWKNRNKYDANKDLTPWLYAIANNAIKDFKRSKKSGINKKIIDCEFDEEKSPDNRNPGAETDEKDEYEHQSRLLRQYVSELPDYYQSVVDLCIYQGMTMEKAANELNIPFNTVKSRLHLAKERLKKSLRKVA